MALIKWWMRLVGAFYLLLFVLIAFLRLPIQAEGPPDALELASMGDPLANFLIDTWVTYGVELGVIGLALVLASRLPYQAIALVWTVIGIELVRGIGIDLYKLTRGYDLMGLVVWIVIHSAIIATGLLAVRSVQSTEAERAPI